MRTDRIQRRQQKGFLLTPADFNSFLLAPALAPRRALCPQGGTPTSEKKVTVLVAPDSSIGRLKTRFEMQSLSRRHQRQPLVPAITLGFFWD